MSKMFIDGSPELAPAAARQDEAQDTGVSVWVAASAGAGKTRVLTNRMMRLLLEGAKPGAILALTYTKAAAKEMASRLIDQARDLSAQTPEARAKTLVKLIGAAPDAAMLQRARSLYETILEAPGGLQIQTIHAFCQSLLGRFPFEAGLTPGFQAIEDGERTPLLAQAVGEVIAKSPDTYSGLLARVQGDKMTELAAALVRLDWQRISLPERLAALEAALGGNLQGESEASLRAAFHQSLQDRRAELARIVHLCVEKTGKYINTFGEALETALSAHPDQPAGHEQLAKHLGYKHVQTAIGKDPELDSAPALAWLQSAVETQVERVAALRLYEINTDIAAFALGVSKAFAAAKQARGVLDFDDLIDRAGGLLRQDSAPTYVQYRLDQRIEHILVDEAQDTSAAQWAVISGLAVPFFADDSGMEARVRTLFVVGDFKQSIYSFQGANPRLFQDQRTDFSARAGARLRRVEMVHSFRSAPTILDFVDAVARRLDNRGLQGVEPELAGHRAVQQRRAGRVEIWPTPAEKTEKPKVSWQPLSHSAAQISARATLGQALARHIHRLCFDPAWAARPEAYTAAGARLSPGDFLVLLQNRRPEFANAFIGELKELKVPVTGIDRLKVSKDLLVQDLLALAEVCLQPANDLALAALLKSPFFGLDEEALFALCHQEAAHPAPGRVLARLRDMFPDLAAALDGQRALIGRASVFEFFAQFLIAKGMRARAFALVGPEAEDILGVFLDRARAFDRLHNGELLRFIEQEWASEQDFKRDTSESAGEVRLMTVHGAKGLEAPVVILPDLKDPARGGGQRVEDQLRVLEDGSALWVPKSEFDSARTRAVKDTKKQADAEERERLLYVAMTRAEERLIICGDVTREDKRDGSARSWYHSAREAVMDMGGEADLSLDALGWEHGTGWAVGDLASVPAQPDAGNERQAPVALPRWLYQTLSVEPRAQKPLQPSALDTGDTPPGLDREPTLPPQRRALARLRGNMIHAALETLPEVARELWPVRLHDFFALKAPDVPEGERETWRDEVLEALSDPALSSFFGPDSKAEIRVSGQVDGQPALGQIDRLHIDARAGEVRILDYKTNRPPPDSPAGVAPVYRAQMAAYAALIAPLYPDFTVRTYLFWTHTTTLMDVTGL